MNEEEARKHLENILKNTENLLKPLDEEAPESVKKFQEMQFKNYNAIKIILNLLEKKDEEIEKYKMMLAENCARTLNSNLKQKHKHEEDLEALHLGWKEEIEKKDDKLKDIKNHIKAELKMIDKLYNEVGWVGKEQYDGMKAAYKCLLNIYFENEVVEEDKLYGVKRINRKNIRNI